MTRVMDAFHVARWIVAVQASAGSPPESEVWRLVRISTLLPCQHYSRAMRVLEAASGVPHVTGMLAQLARLRAMRMLGEDLQFKESR
ncbi:hypothetical protein F8A90_00925 [Cobetia sp. cqz5-12]|uniref:hypothetical protein n=1 Tax=Cobetia sp. cqz5-12 TaxID=2609415 RepID=UPI001902D4BB|nr:hypothetical protein [Cobetia sp. cqz5-12]QQK62873.1 hypothetical protein F8A90_00925 [Cobetia sp. cqz5-12]